jgi:hypothetical protein
MPRIMNGIPGGRLARIPGRMNSGSVSQFGCADGKTSRVPEPLIRTGRWVGLSLGCWCKPVCTRKYRKFFRIFTVSNSCVIFRHFSHVDPLIAGKECFLPAHAARYALWAKILGRVGEYYWTRVETAGVIFRHKFGMQRISVILICVFCCQSCN